MSRRSDIEVAIDILQKCVKPRKLFRLMGLVGMSFQQAKTYTAKLALAGYLTITPRRQALVHTTTPKGREALERLKPALEIARVLRGEEP